LRVDTNGRRDAEPHEPSAVSYRSWLLLAPFPLEPARAFAQAVDDAPLGVWHISLRIDGGLVPDA
jgi:hypothetical protein